MKLAKTLITILIAATFAITGCMQQESTEMGSSVDPNKTLDDVDPKILETFNKLGIPIEEQKKLSGVAVDAIFDSVSVATTYQKKLEDAGVIFCSLSEAAKKYPDLVKKYLLWGLLH